MTPQFRHQIPLLFFLLFTFFVSANGTSKCVWVRGALQCHRDPSKHQNVEVRVIDRDGWGPLKMLDPDDMMGVSFTEQDGTFQLDGCGNDMNFLPGVPNLPDPFVRILHFCNSEEGETIELPEFRIFVPDTYDLGILVLDQKTLPNSTVNFPVPENPRRRLQQAKRPTEVGTLDESNGKKEAEDGFVTVDAPKSHNAKGVDDLLPPGKTVTKTNGDLLWETQSVEMEEVPAEYDTSMRQSQQNNWEEESKGDGNERKNWTKKKQPTKEEKKRK
ncbi:hypothetical protein niasHT_004597 [Heterodera trifolii]|uniref:Uncharacterized protein n=1 Tax=Heterodera trifolii TaxID=157864 RepID=A0ABD2M7B8_9BILA